MHRPSHFALRSHATFVVLALLLACAGTRANAEPGPPLFGQAPRPGPIETEFRKVSPWLTARVARSDELGYASADSLALAAAQRREFDLVHAARFFRGRHQVRQRRFELGFQDLDSVLVAARAAKDTVMIARVWASRGHGYLISGRLEESKRAFTQSLKFCRATQFVALEGFVHRGLGGIAKQQGRLADAEREFTLAIDQVQIKSQEYLNSRLQRAEIWKRRGQHERAKTEFEAILREARARDDDFDAAAALHDLGNMAYEQQDMAAAARNWATAAAIYDSIPDIPSVIAANLNRAQALIHQGRHDEALTLLTQLEARAREIDHPAEAAAAVGLRGQLLHRTGRLEEAEAALRASRAGSIGADEMQYSGSTIEYASLLNGTGRAELAESVLDSLLAPRGVEMTVDDRAYAWMEKSRARTALGRPKEALAAARQAERLAATGRKDGSYLWLDAATELARCQRAAGAPDSAVTTLARAARTWESLRATISNYEWRERYGSGLAGLFSEYGLALLDSRRRAPQARREREAFDALQAFQARTLEERMQGAGLSARAMTRRAGADSLRRVLKNGEVLLDLVATPDTTFAFALSRRGLAVALLPGTDRLAATFEDWRSATLAAAEPAIVERGLARLSRELVAPLAPSLAPARRLIVSGGGALALWPVAALTLPGETAPLGASREVVAVPSATLFTLLRARGRPPAAEPRLLALGRTTTAEGQHLAGADRELEELGSSYAGVTVRENKGDRTLAQLTSDLARFDALHFAAHSEAVESAPWRSGFLLGKGAADDAYFRAASIARMKLKARVAVLSSCSSAGATSLAGEGALGLSSSFLCAGTTSVVATLWQVDDRAAQRFMDALYAELAQGKTIAAAALGARGALRANAATADARDWAAFVVIGEPGTTLPLRKKTLL